MSGTANSTTAANNILPPPRRTGDANADILSLTRWFNDFYDQITKVLNVPGALQNISSAGLLGAPAGWQSSVDTKQTATDASVAALNTSTNTSITALNADITALNGDVTTLNGDITTLNGDFTTLNTALTATNAALAALTTRVSDLEDALTLAGIIPVTALPGLNSTGIQLLVHNDGGVQLQPVTLTADNGAGAGFRALVVPN